MAYLINQSDNSRVYLRDYHTFGRLAFSVTTLLEHPNISRIHAVVEWENNQWCIRDLSTNGLWLNGKKVEKQVQLPLKTKDTISFANNPEASFEVIDLSPPQDLLLRLDESGIRVIDALPLASYNFLPNEAEPEAILFYDARLKTWCLENTQSETPSQRQLNEFDRVVISTRQWQLQTLQHMQHTEALALSGLSVADLHFQFQVSLDEESTQLDLHTSEKHFPLEIRSHHYVVLLLARQKYQDQTANVDPTECGWVYPDLLSQDLGIDLSHLNILIHRARKQFADTFEGNIDPAEYLQRKGGKLRFGGEIYSVIKGSNAELQVVLSANQAGSPRS